MEKIVSIFRNDTEEQEVDSEVLVEIAEEDPVDILSHIPSNTPSASPLMQIPNFIQAILTLIISGLLLASCLILIRKCKYCCTRRKGYYDEENQGEQMVVSETEATEGPTIPEGRAGQSPYTRQASGVSTYSSRSSSRNSQRSAKILRRPSGPFGDEALAHAAETYKKANRDYEQKVSSWARRVSTRRGNLPTTLVSTTTQIKSNADPPEL